MNKLESNLVNSFTRVRKDMLELKNNVLRLAESQEKVENMISELKRDKKSVNVVKTVKSRTASFVAAKEGKKFHIPACPYAKNIKPKSKVVFKVKDTALNQGYKPCSCVK